MPHSPYRPLCLRTSPDHKVPHVYDPRDQVLGRVYCKECLIWRLDLGQQLRSYMAVCDTKSH